MHRVKHQPSLPYQDVGRFLEAVRTYEDRSIRKTGHPTVALWLEFVVLTGVRIGEARLATWNQFDRVNKVWVVPEENHKTGKLTGMAHTMPLTKPMLDVLDEMERRYPDHAPDAYIFPTPRSVMRGKWTSANTPHDKDAIAGFVRKSLKWEMKVVPHGFRKTFTNWARSEGYPPALYDEQLAHVPVGKVRQAYQDDPLVEARRPMMEHWGQYCSRPLPEPATGTNNVASFSKQREKRRTA